MSGRTAGEIRRDAALDFAHAVVDAAQNRIVHGRESRHVATALEAMLAGLRAALAAGIEAPLQLQFSDDAIHFDGVPLLAPSLQAGNLLKELAARDVAALAFQPELDVDEANRLFDLLLLDPNRQALRRPHRELALRALGVRHVRVTSRTPADPGDRSAHYEDIAPIDDLRRYQELATSLHHNHARAAHAQSLAVDETSSAVEHALLRLDQEPSGLLSLAAQDNVDRFTVGHSVRVALLALQVARAIGADREQLVEVGTAALLHDIGKSRVPQEILYKSGKLDEAEWQWMAQHPRLGAYILLEQGELHPRAIGAAFCHHLRADGGGYPPTSIPLQPSGTSKLVRVCDVFEALTSVRPYKRALSPVEAYTVMRRNECDFDQRWFRLFVRTLGLFPQGSRVLLDDGAHALVVTQTENPARPVVRLLTGPAGSDLPAGAPDRVRIGEPTDGRVHRILTVLTHDRPVTVDTGSWDPVEWLSQTVHGACLRRSTDD